MSLRKRAIFATTVAILTGLVLRPFLALVGVTGWLETAANSIGLLRYAMTYVYDWLFPIGALCILALAFWDKISAQWWRIAAKPIRDMTSLEVKLYLETRSEFGQKKTEQELAAALTQVAADARITVWGKDRKKGPYVLVRPQDFGQYIFEVGFLHFYVRHRDGVEIEGSHCYEPAFCRREIEAQWPPRQT